MTIGGVTLEGLRMSGLDRDFTVTLAQGALLGRAHGSEPELRVEFTLDALLQNIVDSSAIEGETLNVRSVRSSIARRLGLAEGDSAPAETRAEGLVQIMWDATANLDAPLTESRLLQWHAWLFSGEDGSLEGVLGRRIRVGNWRGPDAMQVVSGRIDRPTVHFEAPPREGLEARVAEFAAWFNASQADVTLDPLLRAALAHFWFVTLHPFDDGNGRITRALTDLALAQGERQSIRFYAMSAAILADRKGYCDRLEAAQKMSASALPLDLTPWLHWFLGTLLRAIESASAQIDRVLATSRFWLRHREQVVSPEQIKVLNRLLDGDQRGRGGFAHGISAAQYQAVAKVSKATNELNSRRNWLPHLRNLKQDFASLQLRPPGQDMVNNEIVRKLWNRCDVQRDDGINYSGYVTELGENQGQTPIFISR